MDTAKTVYGSVFQTFPDDTVGESCIDSHPAGPDPDHFQGPGILSLRIVRAGDDHRAARFRAAAHGTGVGAVDGQGGTIVQPDIGQEPFVPPEQQPLLTNGGELHETGYFFAFFLLRFSL